MKLLLQILFLLCFTSRLFAQPEYIKFDNLTTSEGISQNTINCFLQDRKGLMWIGTQEGLNLYDGVGFTTYKRIVGDSTSLSDNYVLCIFEDRNGVLWIGTEGGLNKFDRALQRFENFRYNPKDPEHSLSGDYIYSISQDEDGYLWLGTDKGINRFAPGDNTVTSYFPDGKRQAVINDVLLTKNKRMFVAADNGFYEFDRKKPGFSEKLYDNINILQIEEDEAGTLWFAAGNTLFSADTPGQAPEIAWAADAQISKFLLNTPQKSVWIGTDKGVFIYDLELETDQHIEHDPSDLYSLAGNTILALYRDEADVIWIGSYAQGLSIYDHRRIKFHLYYKDLSAAAGREVDYRIRSSLEDRFGNLWIGTQTGLMVMNRKTGRVVLDQKIRNTVVGAIVEDTDDVIWIGTQSEGLFRYENDPELGLAPGRLKNYRHKENDEFSLSTNHLRVITKGRKERLWIGTDRGGLVWFDKATEKFHTYKHRPGDDKSLPNNRIRGVLEDKNGDILVSTYGGGLAVLESVKNGKAGFRNFRHDVSDSLSISSDRVYPAFESSDGTLWVLTYGGGLNRFDKLSGKFHHYTEQDGLPNNVLYGVLEDAKNRLWFSTNRGISRFDPETEKFKNFDVGDGLQSDEFNAGAVYKSKKGEMFFGGVKGLNFFYPDSIKDNSYVPKMVFTDFKLFNESVRVGAQNGILSKHISETEQITLNEEQFSFSIEFAALHFSNSENIRYSYKMEGFDRGWNSSKTGEAKYTNLDPGDYIFRARGTNGDGVMNREGISIHVKIKPDWYRTSGAKIVFAVLFIGLIYGIYRWRVLRVERKKHQLEQQVAERTAELVKQSREIRAKNGELELQREELFHQAEVLRDANNDIVLKNNEIEKKNKNITASIMYASRIQKAMLPSLRELKNAFDGEFFTFFRPRDIVSGDFYWYAFKDEKHIVAAVDCTGHGVPGALMSMLGDAWLDQIVTSENITAPDEVLNHLHKDIKKILKQEDLMTSQSSRDGMDLAICVYEPKTSSITFSGAKNPIAIIKKGQVELIKGNKMPIGGWQKKRDLVFTPHRVEVEPGDCIYLFTDGFQDQFGGIGRKFSVKRLLKLLAEICSEPMEKQGLILEKTFDEWREGGRQIDDVLVLGFRI